MHKYSHWVTVNTGFVNGSETWNIILWAIQPIYENVSAYISSSLIAFVSTNLSIRTKENIMANFAKR